MAAQQQATQQSLLVTYSAPETLLHSAFAAHVIDSIRSQLPIRNWHWKPHSAAANSALSQRRGASGYAPVSTNTGANAGSGAATSQPPAYPVRTIPTLPIQLVELGQQQAKAQAEANAFISPKSASDRPWLHLYLLVCDVSSAMTPIDWMRDD